MFQNINKEYHNTILFSVKDLIDDPAAELLKGTPKISNKIPGYSGYIPENTKNPKILK